MTVPTVIRINGALVSASPLGDASLYEMVRVGDRRLLGEVVRVEGDVATIQVFEETSGLALREPVVPSGGTLTAELGPGLLGRVFDGVGRPLEALASRGDFIGAGAEAATLDPVAEWDFTSAVRPGDAVQAGDMIGTVAERGTFEHRIVVPVGTSGIVADVRDGSATIHDTVCMLEDGKEITLAQHWPVRVPRPFHQRLPSRKPFITGQRVFDFLFPVALGGNVAVPGGFGTGKTIIEQSLAKFAQADVIVYIGCGERGNEMADVLEDFQELVDPRTGNRVMDRTVLVVNTSNMPVAAREASVYLGVTVAEYFRDMGYEVAVMADSLSRWAEALREIAGRLQEMPGEEGYPTYLGSRLSKLYERAGFVRVLGKPERHGAVTLISAVSPPGGDFSEPVTQASLRVCGALWALDSSLAHQRQFPAVDWETSYTLYETRATEWFAAEVAEDWPQIRRETLRLLAEDREIREIAGLIGPEGLEDQDRVILEAARLIREIVIGQSAFDPADAFSSVEKTHALAELAIVLYRTADSAVKSGVPFDQLPFSAAAAAIRLVRQSSPTTLDAATDAARTAIGRLAPSSQSNDRRP